jgi:hypothetical protein
MEREKVGQEDGEPSSEKERWKWVIALVPVRAPSKIDAWIHSCQRMKVSATLCVMDESG